MRAMMVIMAGALMMAHSAFAEVTLVQDGQPVAAIVVADSPSPAADEASRMLQDYIERITGAKLPIFHEGHANETGPRIIVGACGLAAGHGHDPRDFPTEHAIVRVHGDDLLIIGRDSGPTGASLTGTRDAAVMLLHHLGVRWLWPGDTGTVIPEMPTALVAADLHIEWTPVLLKRGLRSARYNDRVQRGLDRLGWSADDFKAMYARDISAWYKGHRVGGSFAGSYGHAFGSYWERFSEQHPEWFALQPDGTRNQGNIGNRSRLCVSNQELIRHIAQEKIAELRARPDADSVSISPNDGGGATFCFCEACQAWDHPDAPLVRSFWPEVEGRRHEHVSLSDRYARFYNEIARIVAEEEPGRMLGAYAYSAYRTVPIEQVLEPNILIGFVGITYMNRERYEEDMRIFTGWAERSSQIFWRPNLLMDGMGFPQNFARPLARDVSAMVERGLTVTDFDGQFQHWALEGLNYYVLAQMLADPSADPDAIIDDYCAAGFGPAAAQVRAYFDALEGITGSVFEQSEYLGRRTNIEVLAGHYDDETLAGLQAHLDAAREAAGGDAAILERIDFLQVGVDYARVSRDAILTRHAVSSGDTDQRAAMEAAEQAREDFYQQVGISWTLNAPYLKYYGF